ncbi:hypothetical protein RJT34_16047 [Clitoria ternatea]|uniref:Uncharacterized protein n=1 Tax=Clitoria ternatea TaxID=43366 RepID=A0AAN9J6H2_CLITE
MNISHSISYNQSLFIPRKSATTASTPPTTMNYPYSEHHHYLSHLLNGNASSSACYIYGIQNQNMEMRQGNQICLQGKREMRMKNKRIKADMEDEEKQEKEIRKQIKKAEQLMLPPTSKSDKPSQDDPPRELNNDPVF